MQITKDSFEDNIRNEYLITNGIGGYSSSTICGCNTRKYHGLLVSALGKTGERMLCLSKINDSVIIRSEEYSLATNECYDFIEKGYLHQVSFNKEYLPKFEYEVKGVSITKEIAMKYGENKVAISYFIKTSKDDVLLELKPLVNFRSFHDTKNCFDMPQDFDNTKLNIKLNGHGYYLHMIVPEGSFQPYNRTFYRNMYYRAEARRGLDAYESLYMPGVFKVDVPKNTEMEISFVAYVDDKIDSFEKRSARDIIRGESVRIEKLFRIAGADTDIKKNLAIASDQFIIEKNNSKTIIAGYHWFGDWGRDTFIALEGLTLKLNRFKDAKDIIYGFKDWIKDGLVPNLISEDGGGAYNSVDASLWYINAIYKYYVYTHDKDFVEMMYPIILTIINAYKNGTLYNIKMDKSDGLISAGDSTTQLTWMDAKVGDFIPTPRYGKAVEINALWYNALKIAEVFANLLGERFDTELSKKVENSFKKFYNEEGLFDTIDPDNDKIRPNQIISLGLDFTPIEKEKCLEIIKLVHDKLYTEKGLRTLSPDDVDYKAYYDGGVFERDTSYHQGTVWPFLLMFYNEAYRKYFKKNNNELDVAGLLQDGCIGSICEIYDGDSQDEAKGAIAQGWSVAMVINQLF